MAKFFISAHGHDVATKKQIMWTEKHESNFLEHHLLKLKNKGCINVNTVS